MFDEFLGGSAVGADAAAIGLGFGFEGGEFFLVFLDVEFEALTLDFEPFDVVVAATQLDEELLKDAGEGEGPAFAGLRRGKPGVGRRRRGGRRSGVGGAGRGRGVWSVGGRPAFALLRRGKGVIGIGIKIRIRD